MLSQLLLALSLLLAICSPSTALLSQRHNSSLVRRVSNLPYGITSPWPKKGDIHPIPYCFRPSGDHDNDIKLQQWFVRAIQLWEKSPHLRSSSLKLTFPVQYQKLDACPQTGDFLTVSIIDGKEIYTTLGFESWKPTMEVGRDFLRVRRWKFWVIRRRIGRIGHELGRNMGLPNENQLSLEFAVECINILGYTEILQQYEEEKRNEWYDEGHEENRRPGKDEGDWIERRNEYEDETIRRLARAAVDVRCRDVEKAISIQWWAAAQLAPYQPPRTAHEIYDRQGEGELIPPTKEEMETLRGWDPRAQVDWDSIMLLDMKAFGDGKKVLYRLKGPKKLSFSVNWYKGPSVKDLQTLMRFYEVLPTYEDASSDPRPVYESKGN